MGPISYSNINTFESCPRKYYHLKVARDVVESESEAIKWGNTVHSALEARLKSSTPLPEGMTQWETIASKVSDIPGEKLIEEKLALSRSKSPTDWKGSWVRGKSDVIIVNDSTAAVFDWKTGQRKLTDQNKFYALLTFGFFPMVEKVKAAFVWLKERKVDKEEFVRDELDQLWKPFEDRIERIEEAHELGMWPERPSGLCKAWCPVTQCKHNGRR